MSQIPESVRRRMQAQTAGEHPDADLLTAFAEQALAGQERERVLLHLSACPACRDLVSLAAPEQREPAEVAAPAKSWFRWPVLRWTAVAATVIVVGAAVSVLLEKRQGYDVAIAPQPTTSTVKAPEAGTSSQEVQSNAATGSKADRLGSKRNEPAVAIHQPKSHAQLSQADEHDKFAAGTPAPVAPSMTRDLAKPLEESKSKSLDGLATKQEAPGRKDSALADAGIAQGALVGGQAGTAANTAANTVQNHYQSSEPQSQMAQAGPAQVPGAAPQSQMARDQAQMAPAPPPPPPPTARKEVAKTMRPAAGVISGRVTDPSGAVVPDALVTITNTKTNTSESVRTDAMGAYRFPAVTPGVYSVEVTAAGMQTTKTNDLDVNGMVAQNMTLHPSAAAETVSVTAEEAPVVGRMRAGAAGGVVGALSKKRTPASSTRWRVSSDGAVERSADGVTWGKVDIDPGVTFRSISSNNGDLWAGGTAGALFHSTDSGRTWSRVKVGMEGMWVSDAITSVSFPTQSTGYVTTASNRTWVTEDAGRTWTPR